MEFPFLPSRSNHSLKTLAREFKRVKQVKIALKTARKSVVGGPMGSRNDFGYSVRQVLFAPWLEITLCSPGQKALTTSRFIRKVNTHFYHARTATCSIRPHKQRVDYPSIPDRGSPPRSFLAPYDDSTSSGSSTGYPESATSD